MSKAWFVIVTLFGAFVLIGFAPELAIVILILNGFLAGVFVMTQILAVVTKPKQDSITIGSKEYFVSIHVPCHNEPFGVVKKTLASLARIDYQDYEVIVIDNNTHDPRIWEPIKEYCGKLGPKFKFLHFENLGGYKAGALNAALKHVDPRTEIIAIVDADYVVKKDFLRLGVSSFDDPLIAIVQYPQAYYNTSTKTMGLEQEYRSFFDNILEQANSWDAVTATGTLSLLRAKLFSSNLLVWNEWCITEDTEISMHLHGLGYNGIFINQVLGQGLMPFNYYSLQRQRERWVHGNMQIIRKDLWPTIRNRHINWQQKLSFFTQLTTWFHPNYLPIVFLFCCLLLASYQEPTVNLMLISIISLVTVIGFILAKAAYFALGLWRRKTLTLAALLGTILTHVGLTITMSLTWLWALTTSRLPFNRTTKDPSEKVMLYIPIDGILAVLFLVGSIISATQTVGSMRVIALVSAGLACFVVLSIWFLARQARMARNIAHELISFSSED